MNLRWAPSLGDKSGKKANSTLDIFFLPVYAFLFLYDEMVVFNDAYEPIAA